MSSITASPRRDRWARLRFSIIGPLLAAPPAVGQLAGALAALAAKTWRHPDSGLDIRFAAATLERWYYAARRALDPVAALRDRPRGDAGRFSSLTPQVIEALTARPSGLDDATALRQSARRPQRQRNPRALVSDHPPLSAD